MATISYKRCLYGFIRNTRQAIIDLYQKPGRQRETPSEPSTALEVIHEVCEIGDAACHDDTIDLRAKLASNLRPESNSLYRIIKRQSLLWSSRGCTKRERKRVKEYSTTVA